VTPLYNRAVVAIASVMIVLGFAILVRTATSDGGSVGYVVGALFVALGAARIHLQRKHRGS
jgi:TRAP-type mannitol/chloroaromatic compound transport system permease large subunit